MYFKHVTSEPGRVLIKLSWALFRYWGKTTFSSGVLFSLQNPYLAGALNSLELDGVR